MAHSTHNESPVILSSCERCRISHQDIIPYPYAGSSSFSFPSTSKFTPSRAPTTPIYLRRMRSALAHTMQLKGTMSSLYCPTPQHWWRHLTGLGQAPCGVRTWENQTSLLY